MSKEEILLYIIYCSVLVLVLVLWGIAEYTSYKIDKKTEQEIKKLWEKNNR